MAVVEMVLERVCAVSLQVEKLLSLIRRTGELLCTLQGFHAQRFSFVILSTVRVSVVSVAPSNCD